jgi:hypothetical protein
LSITLATHHRLRAPWEGDDGFVVEEALIRFNEWIRIVFAESNPEFQHLRWAMN